MTQRIDASGTRPGMAEREAPLAERRGFLSRRFVLTDMPTWLMLLLVALGLPRTILQDLGIVAPGSSLLYYVLALTPFAVWLAVAATRRSARPFMDFLVLGVLYGLSLVVVHQVLWNVGPSLGHNSPASAVSFAEQFDPAWHEVALRGYTTAIAMVIGVGTAWSPRWSPRWPTCGARVVLVDPTGLPNGASGPGAVARGSVPDGPAPVEMNPSM